MKANTIKKIKPLYVDHPFKSPVVLSLCPGILGLERGVERAIGKITVAAYVEIEAFIVANLATAMESRFLDPVPIWTDLKTFNAEPFRNRIHGIIGGYPCQPFSHAGLRRGEDDERHLWPYIREVIRTTGPQWCFFENVRGHLTLGFDVVHRELSEMGYSVEAGIFSAQEVGATHKRERLFILAVVGNTKGLREREPADEAFALTTDWKARGEFGNAGDNVVYPGVEGLERHAGNGSGSQRRQGQSRPISPASLWPTGQGVYQHDWEKPRAVKPGLGCSVDGYNFRTDLLRAYGNAVVEQTAELAFNTLLKKHFDNSEA